ncbi:hypothetical protein QA596_02200 [Balneolales bacterium ANBcel1]|nr:hypothetical protein [Balneolales bacterium ANBcel1]
MNRELQDRSTATADIALLTDRRYTASQAAPDDWYLGNILHDDRLLQEALAGLGLSSVRLDWSDPAINWPDFRCAVFRTTWDYYERVPEFADWLNRTEPQTQLCNNAALIRWNLDKHYLADLEEQGIPIVPSLFLEPGTETDLHRLLSETGWKEAVLKPAISGGARHTWRVNQQNAGEIASLLKHLIPEESFLLQPFIQDVLHTGEITLMVIGGRYTHAVQKLPKPGDFRVQDDHGGTVHAFVPTRDQIALAEHAMAACPSPPAYGRVDLVRDRAGRWVVMELEIIEPELWLRYHPPAAVDLAHAIANQMV